ncbi:MAG TPA: hypothetical protein VN678_03880 [Acidobacteriaceae bacterium]|nr:hypothetical protein [Acidobacteriaceae bacterium]
MGRFVKDVEREVKDDIKEAKKIYLPGWAMACALAISGVVCTVFDHFGVMRDALPVLGAVTVFGFLLFLKRQDRQHYWFWIAIVVFAALHVLLIALIPWTDKWVPAAEYAGGATIDLCVMLVIVDSLHRFIEGPKPRKKSMPAKAES